MSGLLDDAEVALYAINFQRLPYLVAKREIRLCGPITHSLKQLNGSDDFIVFNLPIEIGQKMLNLNQSKLVASLTINSVISDIIGQLRRG